MCKETSGLKHNTLFFPRLWPKRAGEEWRHTIREQNTDHVDFLTNGWPRKERQTRVLKSLLEQSSFSFALVVLDWGVLSILSLCSRDPTFKQQSVMAISAKSVDEVRSWLTDNGFAEYANKFHGKWISRKVNSLSALFSRISILSRMSILIKPFKCPLTL